MKKILIFKVVLCACFCIGCNDIFEKDISLSTIDIITPEDNLVITKPSVLFWWDYLDGSDFYELQIASPNFESIESLIVDTVLYGNLINVPIVTGVYEWRIRACNSAYCSNFFFRSLVISGE